MRIWLHALGWLGASFGAQSPDVIQTPSPGSADGNVSRHLASWPEPAFESRRDVLTADDGVARAADEQGWTALFDLTGPGALVRVAAASSFAGWRVSVDGRELAVPLDLTAADLPFAERCRIESRDGVPAWCSVEWFRFSDGGAAVEAASSRRTLDATQSVPPPTRVIPFEIVLSPSEGRDSVRACSVEIPARASALETPRGAAIGALRFTLTPEGSRDAPRLSRFLRSTVLSLSFDGRETIRLPFNELCSLGSNRDPGAGELEVRWWMPFRHAARLELSRLSAVNASPCAALSKCTRANGTSARCTCTAVGETSPKMGTCSRSAGEVVCSRSRSKAVPSPKPGSRCGPTKVGSLRGRWSPSARSVSGFAPERWTRWYGREAPRFSSAWRIGFAAPLASGCSATTLYYALPSASDDTPALDASLHESAANEAVASVHVPGALECERMVVSGATVGLEHAVQVLPPNETGRWSGGEHLFVRANAVGQFIELDVPVALAGRREVVLHATRSWDYGTFQTFLDGALAGGPLSAFHAEMQTRIGAPRPVSLGVFDLTPPSVKLRVEVVGTDPRSRPPHYYLGLDCVVLKEPQR